jgi:hypothetical protein
VTSTIEKARDSGKESTGRKRWFHEPYDGQVCEEFRGWFVSCLILVLCCSHRADDGQVEENFGCCSTK